VVALSKVKVPQDAVTLPDLQSPADLAWTDLATCPSTFHYCGADCVDNSAVATCGTPCTPCPAPTNRSATCNGTSGGGQCDPGFHACSDACPGNSNTASCGASCTPCPVPANASATCNGTMCDFQCNGGFHKCNGACGDNTSIATCGSSCAPCP